jgi:hypothetical protein
MSQHAFRRQQSGDLRQQREITEPQVWGLATTYALYFVTAIVAFYYYSQYADEKHRQAMTEQAQERQ